jgi:hypothetical protein
MSDTEKKAKFRIRIERLDGKEMPPEAAEGIECESFALLADDGAKLSVTIYDMSTLDLALAIAKAKDFAEAAVIARGIIEARSVHRSHTLNDLVDDLINK